MDAQAPIASWFADNLRRVRKEAGISQEELSIAASVHRTEVSQLERGLRIIRIDTLMKIAGALEVSPCDLLSGLEWTPGSMQVGSFRTKPDEKEQGTKAKESRSQRCEL